ncbi:hypothetical protein ACLB2K_004364 [Fragaria x ananassa]
MEGTTQVITNVFYIPELRNNLLSVGQLQEKGVAILIQYGECKVYHPKKGLIMQTAMSANRMFILLAKVLPKVPNYFQTTLEDNTHLWHCRYGHLSLKGMRTLQYKNRVAYTQQNRVAERKNMMIMNMVRSMLSEKQVPKSFWLEAVNWTMHVLNRSPIFAVKDMTPEEAWSCVKLNADYFWVFGYIGHVHVPDNKRKKLDDKSWRSKEAGIDVLEWGDDNEEEGEQDQSEDEVEEEVAAEEGGEVSLPSSESSENSPQSEGSSPNSHEGRDREAPFWKKDYVSGEGLGLLEGEAEHNLVMFTSDTDPINFEEVVHNPEWKTAMNLEMLAIERNGTWELTDLPKGAKKIGVKWVVKTKLNERACLVDKCKAHLIVQGI